MGLFSTSGLTVSDGINWEEVVDVEWTLQTYLDSMKVLNVSVKHKDQVSIFYLKKGIKMNKQLMQVDSITLFSKLVVILEKSDILCHCFRYELTQFPTSLFKHSVLPSLTRLKEGTAH